MAGAQRFRGSQHAAKVTGAETTSATAFRHGSLKKFIFSASAGRHRFRQSRGGTAALLIPDIEDEAVPELWR